MLDLPGQLKQGEQFFPRQVQVSDQITRLRLVYVCSKQSGCHPGSEVPLSGAEFLFS
jgi:hypothetical protein